MPEFGSCTHLSLDCSQVNTVTLSGKSNTLTVKSNIQVLKHQPVASFHMSQNASGVQTHLKKLFQDELHLGCCQDPGRLCEEFAHGESLKLKVLSQTSPVIQNPETFSKSQRISG